MTIRYILAICKTFVIKVDYLVANLSACLPWLYLKGNLSACLPRRGQDPGNLDGQPDPSLRPPGPQHHLQV